MSSTFINDSDSKSQNLDIKPILRLYEQNILLLLEKINFFNPASYQEQLVQRLSCSDFTNKRYRDTLNMCSL